MKNKFFHQVCYLDKMVNQIPEGINLLGVNKKLEAGVNFVAGLNVTSLKTSKRTRSRYH